MKNILVIAGLIALAGAGYYLFVANSDSALDVNNSFVSSQAEIDTTVFLRRLAELQTITLPDTVLSDARFESFVDFSEPVEEEPFGRENPFEAS